MSEELKVQEQVEKETEQWVNVLLVLSNKDGALIPAIAPTGNNFYEMEEVRITDLHGHYVVGKIVKILFSKFDRDDYQFISAMYGKPLMKVDSKIETYKMDWSEYDMKEVIAR